MVPGGFVRNLRASLGWVQWAIPVFLSPESSIHSWSSVYFFSNAVEVGQLNCFLFLCAFDRSIPFALTANVLLAGALMRMT